MRNLPVGLILLLLSATAQDLTEHPTANPIQWDAKVAPFVTALTRALLASASADAGRLPQRDCQRFALLEAHDLGQQRLAAPSNEQHVRDARARQQHTQE